MAAKLCRLVKPAPLVLTAKIMPLLKVPPLCVVPYNVSPPKTKLSNGKAPSLFMAVKTCKFVKPLPSVLILNIVPLSELPPYVVVPYSVLWEITKPASGNPPSVPWKLYKVVKVCAVTRIDAHSKPRSAGNTFFMTICSIRRSEACDLQHEVIIRVWTSCRLGEYTNVPGIELRTALSRVYFRS